jgi:uncharacterized protein (DUF305 family)
MSYRKDQERDVVTAPLPPWNGFTDADLRFVRRASWGLREAQRASDLAAAWASDPHLRALARRTRAMQENHVGEIKAMLDGWGRAEDGLDHAVASTPVIAPVIAASDLSPLNRLALDRRFIESLTAHAEAAIASARTEMIEGFGPSSRRLAEEAIRANCRSLAALNRLAPGHDPGRVRPPLPQVV